MTTISSHTARTTPRSWLMNRYDTPSSRRSAAIRSSTAAPTTVSSADVTSSQRIRSGSAASARASAAQRDVLSAIRYQPNRAVLHSDRALLPRDEKLWSAWNYFAGSGEPGEQPVGVSYLINKLQPLPFTTPVVVTLNPAREPDPAKVIAEFDYAHPIFDVPAIAAQQKLAGVQGENGIWLAGAWGSFGFHEDGLKSALRVVNGLGVRAPWQGEAVSVRRELEEA